MEHYNRFRLAYVLAGGVLAQMAGGGCAQPAGELFEPLDAPRVWPPPPEQPRIRLIGAISSSRDLNAARSSGEGWRKAVRGPRQPIVLSTPLSVAIAFDRLLAIADVGLAGVHIIDLDARTHTLATGWGEGGGGGGGGGSGKNGTGGDERFATPIGVCWVGKRLFITDAGRHEVIELRSDGGFVRRFGIDALVRPVGIAYESSSNRLFVVDGGAHELVVFDMDGNVVESIGKPGSGDGEFNFPTHIAIGPTSIAVVDSGNFRVQLLNMDGTFQRSIGHKGNAAGDFSLPKGVAFDSEGHLHVVDAQFENVQIFDATGRLLLAYGSEGDALGYFALPAGVAIDSQDRIWVADSANHRVQVFEYLRDAT